MSPPSRIPNTFLSPEPQPEPEPIALAVVPQTRIPTRTSRRSVSDAYQLPGEDESWAPVIFGIIVVVAMLGTLLWLILNSDSCSRMQPETSPAEEQQVEPEPDEQETVIPTPVAPVTPVTPSTDDKQEEEQTEPEKEDEAEDEKEDEAEDEKEDEQEQESQQPTVQPTWVPEKGHYDQTWIVDKKAWDEPVYTQVERTIHHEETTEWVVDEEAWDEVTEELDEEGNPIVIHHEEVGHEEVVPAWDEPTGEYDLVQTGTVHHNEEGHFDYKWVVDEPGHWEYPEGN